MRLALLLLVGAFDWAGFAIGTLGIIMLICTTRPIAGRGYLYPLYPFNGKKLKSLLIRRPITRENT